MLDRKAAINRKTKETAISLRLNLDGTGKSKIATTIGFLDHMLVALARHASFDLSVKAKGDTHVDQHHLVEDIGITLGEALSRALGRRAGIFRAGFWHGAFLMPMDETLAVAAVDLSGRTKLVFRVDFKKSKVGELETDLIADFFEGLTQGARCNLFIETRPARSDHHKVEAVFKAVARALRMATARDNRNRNRVPSTKGRL